MKETQKPVRLHKNLAVAVISCLDSIFNQNLQADKVISKMLKSDKRWGKRDRGFIAENTYEIIRWKRLYAELAGVKETFAKGQSLATPISEMGIARHSITSLG